VAGAGGVVDPKHRSVGRRRREMPGDDSARTVGPDQTGCDEDQHAENQHLDDSPGRAATLRAVISDSVSSRESGTLAAHHNDAQSKPQGMLPAHCAGDLSRGRGVRRRRRRRSGSRICSAAVGSPATPAPPATGHGSRTSIGHQRETWPRPPRAGQHATS
jgi:hypothetical protein